MIPPSFDDGDDKGDEKDVLIDCPGDGCLLRPAINHVHCKSAGRSAERTCAPILIGGNAHCCAA